MSVRDKPNYGIYPVNLSVAGFLDLPVLGTRIILVAALSGATFANVAGQTIVTGGTSAPSTVVNVHIGRALGDPIPFGVNTAVNVDDAFEFVRLSWAAQNSVTAFFLVADDREGAGVNINAPAAILGGSVALQQGGNTAKVTSNNALQVDPTTPEGNSFWDMTPGAAGVTNIFTTAANLNGAIIRYARMTIAANGGELYADTAAPTSQTDTSKRIILGADAPNVQQQLSYPMRIPAGAGLWLAVAGTGVRSSGTYDLL